MSKNSNLLETFEDAYSYCEELATMRIEPYGYVTNSISKPWKAFRYGAGSKDTYFCPNPLKKDANGHIVRDQKHIGSLRFLYVDLDCYQVSKTSDQVLMELEVDYFRSSIPEPTFVMGSGRGLWLFWYVDEHIAALPRWRQVQSYLYECLKPLGADPTCISDTARLCRIPGSVNGKSGKIVSIVRSTGLKFSIYEA